MPQRVWRGDVILPIGDDAAIVSADAEHQLALTADLLVDGVHFPENTDPYAIGYKSLAVNLSDLAAMGAEPAWALMMLSLPVAEPDWLAAFSEGFFKLAEEHRVQLIGGDIVRGPLSIGVQAIGKVAPGSALTRYHARPGDDIYVSGSIGGAALALKALREPGLFNDEERTYLVAKLEYPVPRVALGRKLQQLATAAIDLSDGLALDLKRITEASQVAAKVELELLPVNRVYRRYYPQQWHLVLSGGDDYELCFTAPRVHAAKIKALREELDISLTRIGCIEEGSGVQFLDANSEIYQLAAQAEGYDHFSGL